MPRSMTLPSRKTGTPAARTSSTPTAEETSCKRRRELPVEELRQRQHEDQVQHRGPEDLAARPAEAGQHQPGDPDDQRVEHQVVDAGEVAGDRDPEREPDQPDPRPAAGDRLRDRRHRLQLAQEHVERQDRDHRPVAELGPRPGLGEAFEAEPEQGQGADDGQREPEEAAEAQPLPRPERASQPLASRRHRPFPRIRLKTSARGIHRGAAGDKAAARRLVTFRARAARDRSALPPPILQDRRQGLRRGRRRPGASARSGPRSAPALGGDERPLEPFPQDGAKRRDVRLLVCRHVLTIG